MPRDLPSDRCGRVSSNAEEACVPLMDVWKMEAEIERLRGLIRDLCDPKPGCWQAALKAGRAETAALDEERS